MNDQNKTSQDSAATDLALTETPLNVPLGVTAAVSVPSLLDHSVRVIKAQLIADQIFDRIRLGQSEQHLLLHTIQAIDSDCLSIFLRQLSKRIEGAK